MSRSLPVLLLILLLLQPEPGLAGEDCNDNGVPDATDISQGTSLDCNGNGVPDECDTDVGFSTREINAEADGAERIVTGDVDGDGDLDVLAAATQSGRFSWYPNVDGAGTFGPERPVGTGNFAVSIVAHDVDGDGDLDAVTAAAADDTVAWHENTNGLGLFDQTHVISTEADGVWSVLAADVDGDGDADVLSASQNDNKIAWYENIDGAGTFGPQQVVATTTIETISVAAADLDGDADLDLVAASFGTGRIDWFENADGRGGFGPPQPITDQADGASWVVTADVDGDSDIDVISAAAFGNEIAWYENVDGPEEFGPPQVLSSTASNVLSVQPADFDGDGDPDLVAALFFTSQIVWHENLDGAGTFSGPRTISGAALGATSVWVADIDGDGDQDALSSSQQDDRLAWYENGSDDCDGDSVPDACEPDCDANGIADECDLSSGDAEDCNGNQVPDACDIAAQTSDDCAGEGVPDECEPDCNGNDQADSCEVEAGTAEDCTANGILDACEPDCNDNNQADSCDIDDLTSLDCTQNGIPDECEPDCNGNNEADSCDLLLGVSLDCNGNAVPDECDVAAGAVDCNGNTVPDSCETALTFAKHIISTEADFARAVRAADLDGDGDPDAVSASGIDNKIAWYANDGAGGFGVQQVISSSATLPLSVFTTDLDGDLDIDVLSASLIDDTIAWYENENTSGGFGPQLVINGEADGARSVVSVDLDGDGDRDVISASQNDDTIAWYENTDGSGTFGSPRIISTAAGGANAVFAVDLDGDLDPDVVSAARDDDKISWYRNDGSGNFDGEQIVTTEAAGATAVYAIDLDGDLDADLLSASQDDDKIAWYENTDGTGSFGPQQVVSTSGNGSTAIFAADVDGDGDVDLLQASFYDNGISWYENTDGAGSFGPRRIISDTADGAFSVFAVDVDGDGDNDVLSASQDDDTVAWYENQGDDCNGNSVPDACDIASATSDDCSSNGVPDECEPDCNGNGEADSCDIFAATSDDCDGNGIPDDCDPDCNGNGQADRCDVTDEVSLDCNLNGVPDECDPDCNLNGIPDDCDVADGGASDDCNVNGIPDECEPDCNSSGVPDDCDVAQGADDCNGNDVPDECDPDCNGDGQPDDCDDDCNFNGIPDGCEPDCNDNDVADECDIEIGPSADCNGNEVPDECEAICEPPCDTDGDRCKDPIDSDPFDPNVCSDVDNDGCDDCAGGFFDKNNDGTDADIDGVCDVGDCDDGDSTVWFEPSAAGDLTLDGAGVTTLGWQPPGELGALFVRYDTLRSENASDFQAPALCLETDGSDLLSEDPLAPGSGGLFHYLIRVENDCPGSVGTMGSDSDGSPRTGLTCP